jgi:hypothetical protein
LIVVLNFTQVVHHSYKIGVPKEEIDRNFNSDEKNIAGSDFKF